MVPVVIVVLCGPSGVGKSTLANGLMARQPRLVSSVSHTTRALRGSEENGVHYHFVSAETFEAIRVSDGFAEWADVFSNRYGTAKATLNAALELGRHPLLDIDYQGAQQLASTYPAAVTILVTPPSMGHLEARLRGRGTDSDEQVAQRLAKARLELSQYRSFRYVVVNEVVNTALDQIEAIYRAELRRVQHNLQFLAGLIGNGGAGTSTASETTADEVES